MCIRDRTQPRGLALSGPDALGVRSGEPLEDLVADAGRDAGAVVRDADDGEAALGRQRRADQRPGRRVRPGVGEEVRDHLQLSLIHI